MKRVVPDIIDVMRARYIASLSKLRKFARYWGTTTVDGIEVFNQRKHFYPDIDESTEKLAKYLGIYDEISVEQVGIRSAWLWLNPYRNPDTTIDWNREIITSNLNIAMPDTDLVCTLVIGPRIGKNNKQIPADITTPVSDQAGLLAEIKSKYNDLWEDGHAFFSGEDDPYRAIIVMYLMRTTDMPYTVVGIEETVSSTYFPDPNNQDGAVTPDQVKAWRIKLVIPPFNFVETSQLVELVATEGGTAQIVALLQAQERLLTASINTTPADGDDEGKEDPIYSSLPIGTGEFWYVVTQEVADVDHGTTVYYDYYLRTSILTTTTMTAQKKLQYILSCIDTGFLKKKRKWYEMLIVMIIIIIAVVAAGPAGAAAGSAAAGMGSAISAVVVVAVTITVAALYIALAAMAASMFGATNVAMALGKFLETIAPLVQIASLISVIASIYSIIRKGVEQAAMAAAQRQAQATVMDMVREVAKSIMESTTGITKLKNMTMAHITKMLSFTFDIYKDMQTRDLQREINNYRRDIAAIAESEEKAKTSDIVKDLMASYPNPLANDWSYYSEIYDRPYEWWSTPYHTGNMQATTVNALWLNDPENAILYNNFTGDS